jgi:hypothetical protein
MARIKLGMVGGGNDAFIGGVHRIAARIDDRFELVAGALSSTPEKSAASAKGLGILRSYGSFIEMAQAEASHDQGIEAVSIVTPNHVHAAAAKAFLARGIHVICDKPLTSTMQDAADLEKAVADSKALPDDPAGPRYGGVGRTRDDPYRAGGISPGLADLANGERRPKASRMAHRSDTFRSRWVYR